jgi:hypothetical protein
MATGTILLPVTAAVPPDGSASNAAPAFLRAQGTESSPKKHYIYAAFDASTDEHLWWTFRMPTDYASGGTVKVQATANATSATTARVGVKIGAVTPADADTPLEHATATATTGAWSTNTTEARRLVELSLDCSSNLDSVAAGDFVALLVYRDADGTSGTDDLAVDWELVAVSFEYVTT